MSQTVKQKPVSAMRHKTQISTTNNRKSVQRPVKTMATKKTVTKITPIIIGRNEEVKILPSQPAEITPVEAIENAVADVTVAKETKEAKEPVAAPSNQMSASTMKAEAIEKAMRATTSATKTTSKSTRRHARKNKYIVHFGFKRFALALACATAAVFAIVYFVNLNTPDISLRVAAIQNGINASYPNYVPRDFNLSDITSENGKITLNFKHSTTDDAFSIIEEKSSWDSNSLLTNYVKSSYRDDYSMVKEQGLTLYVGKKESCWVNGGVFYKLKIISGSLTNKQIKTIATSL